MNRKFRELIPLFAIALMIIAAVAFLIIINSDSSKKKKTTKVVENKTKQVEVKEEKEEVKEKDDEVSEPFAENDDIDNSFGDVMVNDTTKETTTTTTVKKTADSTSYIQGMVDGIMGGKATASLPKAEPKNTTTTTTTTTTKETTTTNNTNTNSYVVDEKPAQVAAPATQAPVQTTTAVPQPAKTQQTITYSKQQAATINAYTVYSKAAVGNYTLAVCNGNKLVCYRTSTKVVTSVKDISSSARISKVNGSYAYVQVPGSLRQYKINSNGIIEYNEYEDRFNCQQIVMSGNYIYILSNVNSVIAYETGDGSTKLAEVAILKTIGGVESIVSANNQTVTVETQNGKKTFILRGAMFEER